MIAAPEGYDRRAHFSVSQFSFTNLEICVHLCKNRMYPTQSAANFQNVSRVLVQDSQFCLDDAIGDAVQGKVLQYNPCHTAGLITSGDQNDNNVLRNVSVQGFRYGFVFGEHVIADYLYAHNCEEAMVFHDVSHISMINHLVAQHVGILVSTTHDVLYGMSAGPCNLEIGIIDNEPWAVMPPACSGLKYIVYDPQNRLHGSMRYHTGHLPLSDVGFEFPIVCSEQFKVSRF